MRAADLALVFFRIRLHVFRFRSARDTETGIVQALMLALDRFHHTLQSNRPVYAGAANQDVRHNTFSPLDRFNHRRWLNPIDIRDDQRRHDQPQGWDHADDVSRLRLRRMNRPRYPLDLGFEHRSALQQIAAHVGADNLRARPTTHRDRVQTQRMDHRMPGNPPLQEQLNRVEGVKDIGHNFLLVCRKNATSTTMGSLQESAT